MKSIILTRITALTVAVLASVPLALAGQVTPPPAPSTAPAEPAADTVVSKITIDGQTITLTYGQVKDKLKVLPPQLQSAPFNDIFPLLQKSIETEQIIMHLAKKAKVSDDPEYQKLVQECQKGVMQKLYLDREVEKLATDEEYRKVYDEYKKAAPKENEFDISMITLTDKAKANKVLADAKSAGPAGFAAVANKESMNKIPDGNLGYVRLGDLPEAFRKEVQGAAKATIIPKAIEVSMPDPSDPNKKITTYNIILVKDKRPAEFPAYNEALKAELKPILVSRLMKGVIKKAEEPAKIEHFGMDGKPIENKADAPKADAPKADATAAPAKPAKDASAP
jgi:peptidyl-prolyl cis-trans isomerase C